MLYAAATGLLEQAAEAEPLLLILDDLQWADIPTLSLLRYLATAAGGSEGMMVVGTYRDSDLSRDHPLTALLADLHRDRVGERITLTGLESGDVLALMEALTGEALGEDGAELAGEITRETAGNPFFAVELSRQLWESGAIVQEDGGRWQVGGEVAEVRLPGSVREVIGRQGRAARLRRPHCPRGRRDDRSRLRLRPPPRRPRSLRGTASRPARRGGRGIAASGEL